MLEGKFTDKDKEQVVKFLNIVASKAEFKFNTQDAIDYFKCLSFMQQVLLPKIDSNILEVIKIKDHKNSKESKSKESKS